VTRWVYKRLKSRVPQDFEALTDHITLALCDSEDNEDLFRHDLLDSLPSFHAAIRTPFVEWKKCFQVLLASLETYRRLIPLTKDNEPVIDTQSSDRIALLMACDRLGLSKFRHVELHGFEDYLANAFFRE